MSMALLTEIGAALVWLVTAQECFSYAQMNERRAVLAGHDSSSYVGQALAPQYMNDEVLHPYVGFVTDPHEGEGGVESGLPYATELFDEYDEEPFRVLIVGGSVAGQVTDPLREALVEHGFDEDRLHVTGTATGGYKQPQQLAVLSYLLSLGAEIELVINVDGFNEAVLPVTDNQRADVYPHYPRSWYLRFPDVSDVETARRIGAIVAWSEQRADVAAWMSGSPLRVSVTANVVWSAWDRYSAQRTRQSRDALSERMRARRYQSHGPHVLEDEPAALRSAADVWARSSILMDQLARANGFTYLHFLQPNQYIEGTKPLTDEERASCYEPEGDYGSTAPLGYVELFEAASRITDAGVRYHDLTRIFEDDERTLYEDNCCHFNMEGRRALANRIAEVAAEAMLQPQ